jgi:hypothetical protein
VTGLGRILKKPIRTNLWNGTLRVKELPWSCIPVALNSLDLQQSTYRIRQQSRCPQQPRLIDVPATSLPSSPSSVRGWWQARADHGQRGRIFTLYAGWNNRELGPLFSSGQPYMKIPRQIDAIFHSVCLAEFIWWVLNLWLFGNTRR